MRNFQHTMIFFAATLCACVIDPTDDDDAGGNTDTAATEPGTSNVSNSQSESSQEGGTSNTTTPGTDSTDPDDSSGSGPPDTDTGAGDGMYCTFECQVTEDCYVMGMDTGLTCDGNRCVGGAVEGCTGNEECVAQLSGWSFGQACTTEADCAALMQHCIDVDGAGHCALGPTEFVMCETSGFEEIMMNNIDGDPVTVCGNPNAECSDQGFCYDPCASDADCLSPAAPTCDTTTGLCGCSENAHCETIGEPATSVCLDSGGCGCDSDDDCDAAVGDVCTDFGTCGCSSAKACDGLMNPYDGATIVCAGV